MTEENELSPKAKRIILIVVGILLIPASIGFFLEMTGVDVNGYLNEKLGNNQVTAETDLSLGNDEVIEPYMEKADIPSDFYNKTLYNWMYYYCHQETLKIEDDRSFVLRVASTGLNPDYIYISGVLNEDNTISFNGTNEYQWNDMYKPASFEPKWDITNQNVRVGDDFIEKPHITLYSTGFNTISGYEETDEIHFTLTDCSR